MKCDVCHLSLSQTSYKGHSKSDEHSLETAEKTECSICRKIYGTVLYVEHNNDGLSEAEFFCRSLICNYKTIDFFINKW